MNIDLIKKIGFVLIAVMQFAVVGYLTYKGVASGTEVAVECELYDPYHPLQGRYLALEFPIQNIQIRDYISLAQSDLTDDIQKQYIDKVFVILDQETGGIEDVQLFKPDYTDLFIIGERPAIYGNYIRVFYPFDKFFVQENYAQPAEKILSERRNSRILLHLSVRNGYARSTKITVDGVDLIDLIKAELVLAKEDK